MALILPSEIARLVFGYLEENECVEAAANFLTTSPHLQECRLVTERGRKFGTKLDGHTLTEIVEKYFLVMQFVKERLAKAEDCDSQPADLMVMIKLLLDGPPRGQQRFVVNINVPQPHQTGGSPILAGSSRKRRISNPDRDKSKRIFKMNLEREKADADLLGTETLQRNQLPGHADAVQESGAVGRTADAQEIQIKETEVEIGKQCKAEPAKNSAATDTKELMLFSTAEVQTQDDHIDSDGELESDTPIENLSLLTKEMLNRTEIQEKIAEQINKAGLLPNLSSVIKETSLSENTEVNTSIMTELNNAIKSVVTTTETDPVFEEFLNEIIGTTDESPDGSPRDLNPERFTKEIKTEPENPSPAEDEEIKIKPEEIPCLIEPALDTLDDLNAAAIQSIINANKITREFCDVQEKIEEEKPPEAAIPMANEADLSQSPPVTLSIEIPSASTDPAAPSGPPPEPTTIPEVPITENPSKEPPRRGRSRKLARPPAQKPKPKIVSDEEVVTTLVICNQEQATISYKPAQPRLRPLGSLSYVPIRPRSSFQSSFQPSFQPTSETIFLRAVQVPKNAKPPPPEKPPLILPMDQFRVIAPKIPNPSEPNFPVKPAGEMQAKKPEPLIIFGENSQEKKSDMPVLSAEDSISCSGTGLSPFLKLHKRKRSPKQEIPEVLPTIDLTGDTSIPGERIQEATHEIIKRTPKSLLKSRANNHRLSLSTPRRRSSHVRVLDFSTPTGLNSSRRFSVASSRLSPARPLNKSIPRSSLFNTPVKSPKKKSPAKTPLRTLRSVQTPIATRSPAPTLQGNWNKVSGVDTIIGCDSQSDSCVSPPKKKPKSWDAELRQGVGAAEENPRKSRRNSVKSLKNDQEEVKKEPGNPTDESEVKKEDLEVKPGAKIPQATLVTAKGVTKKYVKLKTLTSKTSGSNDLSSSFETSRSEKEIRDLETPRKFDDFGVPPTPRILSPSSNPSSFIRAHSDETKVAGFVTTPEFPRTPCINITPKHGENTVDALKKDYALYYDPGMYEKPGKNKEVENNPDPKPAAVSSASSSGSTETELDSSGAKLEITQFEVIKENLPKEETCKELRISNAEEIDKSKESEKSLEISRSDDSDSDSDSSSSSSCSSSSCCSDDQSKSKSMLSVSKRSNVSKKSDNLGLDVSDSIIKTDDKSLVDDKEEEKEEQKVLDSSGDPENEEESEKSEKSEVEKEEVGKIKGEKFLENDLVEKKEAADKLEKITEESVGPEDGEIIEASPKKVFPIVKSDKALAETEIETPAKNEELLEEADISETPSGSKNGTETTTTNLTSKISKLINASSHWQQEDKKSGLAEAKSADNVLVSEHPEGFEVNHEVLRRELDEKRLRMIDKLKKNITAKPTFGGNNKGREKSGEKARVRNSSEVKGGKAEEREKIQGGAEVKDREKGNNNDARYRDLANHCDEKDGGFRGQDSKEKIRGNFEEKDAGYKIKDRNRGSHEEKDDNYKGQDLRNKERDGGHKILDPKDRNRGIYEDGSHRIQDLRDRNRGIYEEKEGIYRSFDPRDRNWEIYEDPGSRILDPRDRNRGIYEEKDVGYRIQDPRDRNRGIYEEKDCDYRIQDSRERNRGIYEEKEGIYRSFDPRDRNRVIYEDVGHRIQDPRDRNRGIYDEKNCDHRVQDLRGRIWGNYEERIQNHRISERRDKSRDRRSHRSDEDRGGSYGSYGSYEERGRSWGSNEERGRSLGSNEEKDNRPHGKSERRDRRDDKVRNQRSDHEKDHKVRNQRPEYEKERKEDKIIPKVDKFEKKKEEKVKVNLINHQVKDRRDDRVRSQASDERRDKVEEKDKPKSERIKEEIDKNKDIRREVKLPVVPATRKSARNAARTAKTEEKTRRDSEKDNEKDKKKSEDKSKGENNNKDKASFQHSQILENLLKERLLKESVCQAKADEAANIEEIRKEKKMKVDAVKRDLFSGDEMSDAEGKKVKSSQVEELMMQLHKSDTPELPEAEDLPDKNLVLESLKLQPTPRGSEADLSMNQCEIQFVHDDNVNSKKRYRKTAVDVVPLTVPTEDGDITVNLTLIPHEELFSLQPARAKKLPKKEAPKLAPEPIRYKRKVQLRDSRPVVTSIESQPLATSSPFGTEQPGTSKVVKAENPSQVMGKKERGDKGSQEAKSKQSENKLKDPKLILSKLNQLKIDKLLATVHGPE